MKIASTSLPVLNGLRAIYIGLIIADAAGYNVSWTLCSPSKAQEMSGGMRLDSGRRSHVVPVPLSLSAVAGANGTL